jgi:hypothetical protein
LKGSFTAVAILAAVLAASLPASGATPDRSEFLYTAPVSLTGERSYAAVRLTPEIFAAAGGDLSSMILLSEEGSVVPYFVNTFKISSHAVTQTYEMRLADSFIKDDEQYLDYTVLVQPSHDILASSIHMEAAGEFVKDITVFGGYDGVHWERIKNDTVYQVDGNDKLALPLPMPYEKYTWYRFMLSEQQRPLLLERVWLEYNSAIIEKTGFTEEITPDFSITQDRKTTVIRLPEVKCLSIDSVEIGTESMFKREVRAGGVRQTLYNLRFAGSVYERLVLPLDGYQSPEDGLEIRIEDRDDAPILINVIKLRYYTRDLVFPRPSGEKVFLYFGNEKIQAAPQYDIAAYKEYILADGYDILTPEKVCSQALPDPEPEPEPEPEEQSAIPLDLLFNIVIIGAAAVLAAVILMRLRRH